MFKKSMLGLAVLSTIVATSAKAEMTPYVGVYGHRTDAQYSERKTRSNFDDKAFGFSLSAGVDYSNFSTELEYFQTDEFKDIYKGLEGELKLKSVGLSQFYSFKNDTDFTPYIGAGVSLGKIHLGYEKYSKDFSKLGLHAGVGVQYELTDALSLDLGYRYMDFGRAKTHIEGAYTKTHIKMNDVYLGLVFRFGENKSSEEHVVRKVVVGSTPVAAAKAKNMKLIPSMFGSASSKLNQENKKQLMNALADFKGEKDVNFNVYGYTDRIGSEESNKVLSQKRADAIADILRSNGFADQVKKVEGRGETNSLVGNSCDSIKEKAELNKCLAADRRVEIDVVK
ncbi:MAG: outer membrane beta-barrel protein [Alphaproteobacteria bacterium]|nr:outer membrane beta-barrel protein [Alphaproteobacteria bacterium]